MAGHGPAPKPADQRRDRHVKQRGEWIDLPARRLGPIPKGGPWNPRTMQAWRAWWRDPAATQWTDADKEAVWALAELMESWPRNAAEIRLRADLLGLSQKGKRDMRWRIEVSDESAEVERPKASASRRARLKVV